MNIVILAVGGSCLAFMGGYMMSWAADKTRKRIQHRQAIECFMKQMEEMEADLLAEKEPKKDETPKEMPEKIAQ
jgi:hypothetical protein